MNKRWNVSDSHKLRYIKTLGTHRSFFELSQNSGQLVCFDTIGVACIECGQNFR